MNQELYEEVVNFEADVDEATFGDFPPIPADDYLVRVIEPKLEETKKGAPMYNLAMEVVDGEFKGRRLWHRRPVMAPKEGVTKGTLGFVKSDAKALRISLGQIKVGEAAKTIVRESRGRMVVARVGFGSGDYANKNEVKALLPSDTITDTPVITEADLA